MIWESPSDSTKSHPALGEANLDTVLVSACDKLHNAVAIASDHAETGDVVFDRFSQPKPATLWYYLELERVLATRLGDGHRIIARFRSALAGWA